MSSIATRSTFLSLSFVWLSITAGCNLAAADGADGKDGASALMSSSALSPGSVCAEGGTYLRFGLDANGNGQLDEEEVSAARAICNGADGDTGTAGTDGSSCSVTDNGNGTKSIACEDGTNVTVTDGSDGQAGATGPRGDAGSPGAPGAPGSSCTVVDNNDGTHTILCDDGTSTTVSDGSDGQSGLISLIRIDPELGGPNCTFSGYYIRSGIDDDGDNVLQDEEIDTEALICSSSPGACADGYAADADLACMFVNPCDTDNGGCDDNAVCTATNPDDLSCTCQTGYSGDGQSCTFINPCDTDNGGCDDNATCSATNPTDQACTCNTGYAGDGYSCTFIDPCDTDNGGCHANATCTSTSATDVTCACNTGFNGDGQTCSFICGSGTQALEGKLVDQDGELIRGNGHGLGLSLWVQNTAGTARSNVQTNGYFAFCVPDGTVDVSLAYPSTGFFNRNDQPNPNVPYYIVNVSPSVSWTAADGELVLGLPNTKIMNVRVTENGAPAAGVTVASYTRLTSESFVLHSASATSTTLSFEIGQATTNADGIASFVVYDTATPLTFTASITNQGVQQTATLENVDIDDADPTLVLPDPPQLLTGTLKDANGLSVPGNGNGFSLSLWVANGNGYARSNVDTNGEFSFYVPGGTVDVSLAYPSTGFFNRNDQPNPEVPFYISNINPSVAWTSTDGDLALTLPATTPLQVSVTSGGAPVQGASVSSNDTLTSNTFTLHADSATTTTLNYQLGSAQTDVNGTATFVAYPSASTFTLTASRVVEGVNQTASLTGAQVGTGVLQIVLPDPPQLLTGTLRDTNGNLIHGTGHSLGLSLWVQNDDGNARSNVDSNGEFSFYVPGGTVNVSLAYPSTGFFNRNDVPNPEIPYYVHNITPALAWTLNDGPLNIQVPAVVPVNIHIESGGTPVQNAFVYSYQNLTSTAFELVAGDASTSTTAKFRPGEVKTDANGDAVLYIWPTAGETFDLSVSADVTGATLTGTITGIAADGTTKSVSYDLQ